ncbi:MAG: hypothetical protein ABIZ04_05690 [Opitutus sp.]
MMSFTGRLLSFILWCTITTVVVAQTEWSVRNPTPSDATIGQVAFGAGKFVGVGSGGAVITSTDGETWTETSRLAGHPFLSKVIYGGGQFVALDGNGVSYTSPTGDTWTKRTSTGGLGELAYGNGTYVAISTGNLFATSPDAITWTQRTTGTTLNGSSITFGANLFAASTGTKVYLTTPDGATWTPRSFPSGLNVTNILFGNGFFVALLNDGTTAQSTDAITWTLSAATVQLREIGFANGRFFAGQRTSNQNVSSTDGLTWVASTALSYQAEHPATIRYGNGAYVTIAQLYGYSPISYYSFVYSALYSSTDADAWMLRSQVLEPPPSVAYGLGMFVAGKYVSSDGVHWAPGGFGTSLPSNDYYYYYSDRSYRYKFAGGRFFAFQQNYPYRVYSSSDGVTSSLALTLNSVPVGVSYGAGRYVIISAYNQVMVSDDAVSWNALAVANDTLSEIIFANDRFVIATATDKVLTSSDGLTWTARAVPTIGGSSVARLAYGNGVFVLVRENGETFTSGDAITWVARPTLTFQLSSLAFANGTFVGGGPNGTIYTSTDGINWTARESHSSSILTDLAYGNGQWVAVSRWSGTLVQSDTTSGGTIAPNVVVAPHDVSMVGEGSNSVTLLVSVTGTGPFTYQWYRDNVAIPGQTGQTLGISLPAVTSAVAQLHRVTITGPGGTVTSPTATVTNLPPQPPVVASQPVDVTTIPHGQAGFNVTAAGSGPFTYQWRKDGQPLASSAHHPNIDTRSASIYLGNLSPFDEGLYDVVITGRAGSVTSRQARLTLRQSRLINLSARANVGTGENALFAGFVLANDNGPVTAANWTVLARAAGPALKSLGVTQFLANPIVDLYQVVNGQQVLQANNDNWSDLPEATLALYNQLSAAVGAFPFDSKSLDAALLRQGQQLNYSTTPQVYSAVVRGASGESGVALLEFYDASSVHARLLNLSARAKVGSGENILIAGFVVTGSQPLKVLLRGVGPSLAGQGITAFLKNPKLTLFNNKGVAIQSNDVWSQNTKLAELVAATSTVGAFALTGNSEDAAMLLTLDPGAYSVQVSSVDGSSGIALAEIYEVP